MNKTTARSRRHGHPSQNDWAMRCRGDDDASHRVVLTVAACAIVLLTACGGDRISASPTTPTPPVLPTRPTSPLAGTFQISFSADPACATLPPVARTRTYSATSGGNGLIDLAGAKFGGDGSYLWNVIYPEFAEDVTNLYFQDPPIWEQLTADQYVVIYGIKAVGTIRDLPVTLSFPGRFSFCAEVEPDRYPECVVPEIVCTSNDHELTISRQ